MDFSHKGPVMRKIKPCNDGVIISIVYKTAITRFQNQKHTKKYVFWSFIDKTGVQCIGV